MKKLTTLLIALLISIASFAQQGINYKALIKDANGNVMINQNLKLKFAIQELGFENDNIYEETHTTTTDANGIVVVTIGEGADITGDFFNICWGCILATLKTEIDLEPYDDFVLLGIAPFQAVPYAKFAKLANRALSADNVSTKIDDLSDGKSDADGSSLFVGLDAGLNDDGSNNSNVGIGFNALKENTTGIANTANGVVALSKNTEGDFNTANGLSALRSNRTGHGNTANGSYALNSNMTGNFNVAIGYSSGYFHNGSGNVFIGTETGRTTSTNESNKLYINNERSSQPLIYGEFDTNLIRINGTLDVTEEIQTPATGSANMIPIAYGSISSTGTSIYGGTGNFTVSKNAAHVYTIIINGESIDHINSTTTVSIISGVFRTSSVSHSGGNVRVHIFDSSFNQVANSFQFVIYKQ